MDGIDSLFKPGQEAESRSFCIGYRGAWFHCKIRNVRSKNGTLMFETKYVDFPDQKVKWEKVYRQPGVRKDPKLMFRPKYPALYKEGEVPDISSISEVAIIVNNTWREGDLVDWFCQDCYWSGKITQVLGNGKLMVELFPPPDGEGSAYEALAEDLRPSLDWSPDLGWTLPKPVKKGQRPCARLVKPNNQGKKAAGPEVNPTFPNADKGPEVNPTFPNADKGPEVDPTFPNADKGTNSGSSSGSSDTSSGDSLTSDIIEKISKKYIVDEPLKVDKVQNLTQSSIKEDGQNALIEGTENKDEQNGSPGNPSKKMRTLEVDKAENRTQSAITEDGQNASIEGTENKVEQNSSPGNPSKKMRTPEVDKAQNPTQSADKEDGQSALIEGTENQGEQNGYPSKKMRSDRSISRNIMSSDAIEAAVLDLEELRNRVKWIKDILQGGIPAPYSKHPSWTFVEHKAPSLPR